MTIIFYKSSHYFCGLAKIMIFKKQLFLIFTFLFSFPYFLKSQCVAIESILVDACGQPELENEMLRFKVGPNNLNVSNMTMTFGFFQPFTGIRTPDFSTASKVSQLNATVQSCGFLKEPIGGVLPANSTVLVIGSVNVNVNANPFTTLSDTIIVLFKNSTSSTTAYYINYAPPNTPPAPDAQTTTISFGQGCMSTVTYLRSQLINQNGLPGAQDGATVNFSANGTPTYINNGCIAPFTPISAQWNGPGTVCETDSPINLNTLITGTQGGVFTGQGVNNGFFNPSGNIGSFNITYTINIGGCERTQTNTIIVIAQPNASWTLPSSICAGETIQLNSLISGTPGGAFSGQGVSGNTFNSSNLNGNINITYAVGSGSCQATSSQTIQVIAVGNANWQPPSEVCEGQTIDLNSFVTGNAGGVWTGQGVNVAGSFNSTGLTGSISITYTVGSGTCEASQIRTINIIAIPNSDWDAPNSICEGEIINLDDLITGNSGGAWSGNGVSGNSFNASGLTGAIEITYQLASGNCTSTSIQSIDVINLPSPLVSNDTSYCQGDSIQALTALNSEDATVVWYADNSLNNELSQGINFLPPSETATYYVVFKQDACISAIDSVNITISQVSTQITANTDDANIPFNLVASSQSVNALSCEWFLNEELINYVDGQNYLIETEGEYVLKHVCVNSDGCTATDEISFNVSNDVFEIKIPNVFTPNDDGINDEFVIESKGVSTLSGNIFNRWGNLVFSWEGVNTFWSGEENTSKAPDGVYFYVINILDNKDKQSEYKGTVTLIR